MDQSATLMKRFDLRYPIIQAPLAGGGDTPELVAAVCNVGGMGFIGAAYLTQGSRGYGSKADSTSLRREFVRADADGSIVGVSGSGD
jgi:nitronate monooxygenase